MPPRIALIGGIGSGKSTAAGLLAGMGAVVVSADDEARAVLAPGTAATAAVLRTWPDVGAGGVVDRSRLARIVFADPAALAALEAITHPDTRARIQSRVASHPDEVVVVELPLMRDWFDESWLTVVVDAPDAVRLARVLARSPGVTADDVADVMARQPTRAEWLLAADYVLDNSGEASALSDQCSRLWELLGSP